MEHKSLVADLKIDKFRFFIRDEEDRQRSSVWFAHHRGNDVYVGTLTLGGHLKLSLHRDQTCQCGLVRSYRDKLYCDGLAAPRLVRWSRPQTPERGAVHVASIFFPTDFLRGEGVANSPGKLKISLPMAPSGQATEVGFFYSFEQPDDLEPQFVRQPATPILYMTLPSGEYVSIVVRHVPFNALLVPDFSRIGSKFRPLDGAPQQGGLIHNAHAILFGDHSHEQPGFSIMEVNGLTVAHAG